MKIEFREESLQDVLSYFVKGYKAKEGQIVKWEGSITMHSDHNKSHVIFKLYLKDEAPSLPSSC